MKKIFNTVQSDLLRYNGTEVEVIGDLEESEYDKDDVGSMYKIMFYDGKISDAFEDELIDVQNVLDTKSSRDTDEAAIKALQFQEDIINTLNKRLSPEITELLLSDIPNEFGAWIDRMLWHVKKCNEYHESMLNNKGKNITK